MKDEVAMNFGSTWQSDYFCAVLFFTFLLPITLSHYTSASGTSSASEMWWKGASMFTVFILYALITTPMYVWSVGQGNAVWDDMENKGDIIVFAQTMSFMIVFIYFFLILLWTKGSIITVMFPMIAFNGATMFYYEQFPTAIINGMILNGVFLIYLFGSYISKVTFQKREHSMGLLVFLILVYYGTIFAFWPALSSFYGGGLTGHGYTEFHESSFFS
jgi:hypothetical protein